MTILTQLHVTRLLALGMLLILPATSGAQQRPPILEKLTKTYGLESFGQIEAIHYTFNVEAPGLNVSRSWVWLKVVMNVPPRVNGRRAVAPGNDQDLARPVLLLVPPQQRGSLRHEHIIARQLIQLATV